MPNLNGRAVAGNGAESFWWLTEKRRSCLFELDGSAVAGNCAENFQSCITACRNGHAECTVVHVERCVHFVFSHSQTKVGLPIPYCMEQDQ